MESVLKQSADMLVQVVLLPGLLALGSTLIMVFKKYVERIGQSMLAKYEVDSLKSLTSVVNNVTVEIDKAVNAAVANMMTTVDKLKSENDGTLSDEDVAYVQQMAKELIYQSLPDMITGEDEVLNKAIGGTEALDTMIAGMIEKHVTVQKALKKQLSN